MKDIPSLTGPFRDVAINDEQARQIRQTIAGLADFEIVRFYLKLSRARLAVFGIGDETQPNPPWREWVFDLQTKDCPRLLFETRPEFVALSEAHKLAFAKVLRGGQECSPGTTFMLGAAPVCIRFVPPYPGGFLGTALYVAEGLQVMAKEGYEVWPIQITCRADLHTGEVLQIIRQVLINEQPFYEGGASQFYRGYFPTRIDIRLCGDGVGGTVLEVNSSILWQHGFRYGVEQGPAGPVITKGGWWVS